MDNKNNARKGKIDLDEIRRHSSENAEKKSNLDKFETVERFSQESKGNEKKSSHSASQKPGAQHKPSEKKAVKPAADKQSDKEAQKLKRRQEAEKARKEKEKRLAKKEKEAQKAAKREQAYKERQAKSKEKERIAKEKEKAARRKEAEKAQRAAEKKTKEITKSESAQKPSKQKETTTKPLKNEKKSPKVSDRSKKVKQEKAPNVEIQKASKLDGTPDEVDSHIDAVSAPESLPQTTQETEKPDVKEPEQKTSTQTEEASQDDTEIIKKTSARKKLIRLCSAVKSLYTGKFKWVAAAVTCLVLVVAVVFSSIAIRNFCLKKAVDYTYFGNVETVRTRNIEISPEEQTERSQAIKRRGQTNAFDFFTNDTIRFNDWFAEGTIVFGNIKSNNCVMILTIRDDDGEVLYRSEGIEAGKYLPTINLFKALPDGVYKKKLYVAAYNADTYELLAVQSTKLTLIIGDVDYEQHR